MRNTDIKSISGGKVADVRNFVQNYQGHVDEIVTLVGSNDCAEKERQAGSVQDVIDCYSELIDVAKSKSNTVMVSSLCPRTEKRANENIDAVNAGLQKLCTDKNCKFIDNHGAFILADG